MAKAKTSVFEQVEQKNCREVRWSIEAIGPDTQRKSGSVSEKMDATVKQNSPNVSTSSF
jgi:hypothetical protein